MTRNIDPKKDSVDKELANYFAGETEQGVIRDLIDNDTDKLLFAILQEVKGDVASSPSSPSRKGTYQAEMNVIISNTDFGTHDKRDRYDFGFVASALDIWYDNPLEIRWTDAGGREVASYPPASTPLTIEPFNSQYLWVRKPSSGSDVEFSYVAHD